MHYRFTPLADDLAAWRQFINEQRVGDIAWQVWIGLAILFALIALAPWVLPNAFYRVKAWRTGKPRPGIVATTADPSSSALIQGVSDKLQEATGENVRLATQLEQVRAERDRERGDKEILAKECTELQLAVQNREGWLRDANWRVQFKQDRPVIPDLPLRETEEVRNRTQELRPALMRAGGQCDALLRSALDKLHCHEEATGFPWLAAFIEQHEVRSMGAAWRALDQILDSPQDIRRTLIGFCWNYAGAKTWLIRVLGLRQWAPEMASEYERWREAGRVLQDQLGMLLARNSMQAVREQIQRVPAIEVPPWPVTQSASDTEARPRRSDGQGDRGT